MCNIKRILSETDSSLWDLLVDQLCQAASGKDSIIRMSASDTLTEMIKTTLELQDPAYLEKTEGSPFPFPFPSLFSWRNVLLPNPLLALRQSCSSSSSGR